MLRRDGNVPMSHHGRGGGGYHVGPVSAEMRMASTEPIADAMGQPHPIKNTSLPAASRMVRSARSMASARLMVKSNLPFPSRQAAYKKSIFKTLKPQFSTAR